MYYAPAPGSVPAGATGQEKQGNIYIPGQGPYAAHVPPGFAPAQQVMPNGLTAAHYPQAYAMVSTPGGHPAYAPGIYSSMPYPAGLAGIPTSSHAYLSAAQYQASLSNYQAAALAAGRTAGPPQHYTIPTPVQAGAPLFAGGYTPVPAGIAAQGARSVPIGPVAAAAGYPPGFTFPAPTTEGNPMAYTTPPGYGPQF